MDREIIQLARQHTAEALALQDRALEQEQEPTLTLYSQRDPRWRDVRHTRRNFGVHRESAIERPVGQRHRRLAGG
jgi:hypothetical protein